MRSRVKVIACVCVCTLSTTAHAQVGDWMRQIFGLDSRVIDDRPTSFALTQPESGLAYVRFLAIGDFGTGDVIEDDVAKGMALRARQEPVSFIVSTGDNFYEDGVTSVSDPQWKRTFEDVFPAKPELRVPFYAVLGNHDIRSNSQAQIDYSQNKTFWTMPGCWYSFTSRIDDSSTIAFFCLDTNPLAYLSGSEAAALSDTGAERRQLRWLDSSLSVSSSRWKIVVGHHTIFSNGSHGENEVLRDLLLPILARSRADLYLCGHDHHLEMLKPVSGVNFVISGAGGKRRDVTWRENTMFAATNYGSNFFRVSAKEIVLEFLDRTGRVIYATTISKK